MNISAISSTSRDEDSVGGREAASYGSQSDGDSYDDEESYYSAATGDSYESAASYSEGTTSEEESITQEESARLKA